MKTFFLSILAGTLAISTCSFAQNETNHWMFGTNSGLDFSSGAPVPEAGCMLNTLEGVAAISDPVTGNLLMYTDGSTVYSANHTPMPNGIGLLGHWSATQAALIVPKPGSSTLFYVFTADGPQFSGTMGYNYSVVDMALNGGLGDVIPTQKNVLLYAPSGEQLSAVKHANCTDWWIMTKGRGTNVYNAYLLTSTGLSAPITSIIGFTPLHVMGQAKFSPDGTKYAITTGVFGNGGNGAVTQLFDFDNTTGLLGNPITLATDPIQFYGLSFSGDNSKLYTAEYSSSNIYQYDLSSGIPASIIASRTIIGNTIANSNQFQLGKDFKIYIAHTGGNLSVIDNPNALGAACGLSVASIPTVGTCSYGLPNFPESYFNQTSPCLPPMSILTQSTHVNCSGANDGTASVQVTNNNGPYTVSWSPGGATTDTITGLAPGTYTVTVTDSIGTIVIDSVVITSPTALDVAIAAQNDSVCVNATVTVNAASTGGTPAYSYQWPADPTNTSNSSAVVLNSSRYIHVTVTDANGCTNADSLFITAVAKPAILFTATPKTGCTPLLVEVTNSSAATTAQWTFGDGTTSNAWAPAHTYTASGCHTLHLTVTDALGCVADTNLVDYICIFELPTADFTFSPSLLDPLGSTVVQFDNQSSLANTYFWSFPQAQTSTVEHPSAEINAENTEVCLRVASTQGCLDSICRELPLAANDLFFVPNAFTPDNDYINDVFKPVVPNAAAFVQYELLIFNRYGEVIFAAEDLNQGWNGQYNGANCPDGVYTWKAKLHLTGNKRWEQTGHVTLIR